MPYLILYGRNGINIDNRNTFEDAYFIMARSKKSATGYIGDKEVFKLRNGEEMNEKKRAIFSDSPLTWRQPEKEEIYGLLNQFQSLGGLAKKMYLNANTVQLWKRNGRINFFVWRYIIELAGISTEIKEEPQYKHLTVDEFLETLEET
jgi:hypothetical protein